MPWRTTVRTFLVNDVECKRLSLIGTVRGECLDRVLTFGELHLRRY